MKVPTSVMRGSKPTPFVIFATQRTGSNWLMGMLDAHPSIAAYDELLLAGASGSGYWGRTDLELFEPYYHRHRRGDNFSARAYWSFRYLNQLYDYRSDAEAVGMKLMYDQLWKNPLLWIYMMRNRVRVVHLVRLNLFDILLSVETAKARNRPHALEGHVFETPAVTLDPQAVVSTLRTLEFRVSVARRLLMLLPVDSVEISYERLTADPNLVDGVFAFLGVTPIKSEGATSRFKKLNTSRRSDLVANYADVEKALRATSFGRFLAE